MFDPHRRAWEPEVLDDLGGDLFGSVEDGRAGIIGKLGADYDSSIPVLLREVQADAAPRVDFGYALVRVNVIGGQVHQCSCW
jgi:hypothetical protein